MKTKLLLFIAIPAGLAALNFGYVEMSREQAADAEADQPVSAASRVQHDADGKTSIVLNAKTQQLIGLETTTLAAVDLPPEMSAYGRVLDSARLITLENGISVTRASLQASQKEYERLKKLSAQDNASAQALETAEAKLKQDQGALDTAEVQLAAASCRALLAQPAEFVQALSRQDTVLVRLDLPAGESPGKPPVAAKLKWAGEEQPVAANFLGRAATTDPQAQGLGFVFVVTNAPGTLTPGLAVTGWLQLPGKPATAVIVPDDAVVRSDERAWIYVQTGETNFTRRKITLDHPAPGGWF
ncbi:MAG TPA: hypothetical protein VFF11_09905, partial [Candidatus Binatia bacterium]|nr:hypothetical protein [Candidatus Binatia bacterium]